MLAFKRLNHLSGDVFIGGGVHHDGWSIFIATCGNAEPKGKQDQRSGRASHGAAWLAIKLQECSRFHSPAGCSFASGSPSAGLPLSPVLAASSDWIALVIFSSSPK